MSKSAPKQKPLGSKKKMPISILGLLGMALVLVGIVAAIGLMQINQDSRSNAGGCHSWQKCDMDVYLNQQAEKDKLKDQAIRKAKLEANAKANQLKADQKKATDWENAKAKTFGTPGTQQPTGTTPTAGSGGVSSGSDDGGSNRSGGSSSTGSIAPINMRVECSSDNKSATIRWDVKSKASTFFVAVDKRNSCDSPLDGWRCPGDFVKTVNCTALSCSYKFKVDSGAYGTVAITAIKGDQRIESKLTKGFACRY